MNQNLLTIIAFLGGICLAVQSIFSSQLGEILKKPILASISTYSSGAVLATIFFVFFSKETISLQTIKQVPWYLWFIGGLFSVVGITLYYFAIPKIGLSKMIALGLCGQLFFSVLVGHFGWFNLPLEPITVKRTMGVFFMILGILLLTTK